MEKMSNKEDLIYTCTADPLPPTPRTSILPVLKTFTECDISAINKDSVHSPKLKWHQNRFCSSLVRRYISKFIKTTENTTVRKYQNHFLTHQTTGQEQKYRLPNDIQALNDS